jgi:hypothetical protein
VPVTKFAKGDLIRKQRKFRPTDYHTLRILAVDSFNYTYEIIDRETKIPGPAYTFPTSLLDSNFELALNGVELMMECL